MISRALLRFATVSALTQHEYDPSPLTLAGEAVFDSRLDDIEFEGQNLELPLVTVYTEADERIGESQAPVPVHELRHIDLLIEIALGSFQKTVDGSKHTYVLPTTDSELEFLLDCFEQQVFNALFHPLRPASLAWRKQVIRLEAWHSTPFRSSDRNNRLAARTIHLRCRVNPMCQQRVSTKPLTPQTEVPYLTDAPYLNAMIEALSKDEASAGLMAILREHAGLGPQLYVPPFLRMQSTIDSQNGSLSAIQTFIAGKLANPNASPFTPAQSGLIAETEFDQTSPTQVTVTTPGQTVFLIEDRVTDAMSVIMTVNGDQYSIGQDYVVRLVKAGDYPASTWAQVTWINSYVIQTTDQVYFTYH